MTQLATTLALSLIVAAGGCGSTADFQPKQDTRSSDVSSVDSVDEAIRATMAEARQAVTELGVTEPAMQRIQTALRRLAETPGLRERSDLRELHGGGAAAAVLASDGKEDLTLILTRFEPGKATPIHDHGSWAVAYLVEGRERYVQWEREDDGSDPERAEVRVEYERILHPGDALYWLDPPHDIHSQQALDEVAWELLLFGRNPQQRHLHYFDPGTGRVTTRAPVAATAPQ